MWNSQTLLNAREVLLGSAKSIRLDPKAKCIALTAYEGDAQASRALRGDVEILTPPQCK